ncbi:hypothetical protein BpHYR1_010340, partial [Brachionus plicatilis]
MVLVPYRTKSRFGVCSWSSEQRSISSVQKDVWFLVDGLFKSHTELLFRQEKDKLSSTFSH